MLFLLQRDEVLQTSEMSDCSFPAVLGSWQLQRSDKNDSAFLHIILYKASPSCSETEYFTQMLQRVWRKLWSKLDMWLWLLHFIAGDKGNVFFPSHLLLSAAATYSPEACVDTGQVPPTQCRFLLGDELIWQNAE